MEYLFLIKLVVAVAVVVGLSVLAEHVSTKLAGLIAGCPTGTAISLFFFGLENSPEFAADSALYNLVGLVAMQAFIFFYYLASSYFRRASILLSSIVAIAGYFLTIALLSLVPDVSPLIAVVVAVLSVIVFIRLFRPIDNHLIESRRPLSMPVLFMRAVVAASIILLVTGVAHLVGPAWAGLFSAFPTTTFPLMLIVHYSYDAHHVHTIIKNLPVGLGSLITYSLTIYFTYPSYGIYGGTLLSFATAALYLLIFQQYSKRLKKVVS